MPGSFTRHVRRLNVCLLSPCKSLNYRQFAVDLMDFGVLVRALLHEDVIPPVRSWTALEILCGMP